MFGLDEYQDSNVPPDSEPEIGYDKITEDNPVEVTTVNPRILHKIKVLVYEQFIEASDFFQSLAYNSLSFFSL